MTPDFYPHTFHIVSSSDCYPWPPVFFLILYPVTLVTRNPVASHGDDKGHLLQNCYVHMCPPSRSCRPPHQMTLLRLALQGACPGLSDWRHWSNAWFPILRKLISTPVKYLLSKSKHFKWIFNWNWKTVWNLELELLIK